MSKNANTYWMRLFAFIKKAMHIATPLLIIIIFRYLQINIIFLPPYFRLLERTNYLKMKIIISPNIYVLYFNKTP